MTHYLRAGAGITLGVLAMGVGALYVLLATAAHWIHPVSDEEGE